VSLTLRGYQQECISALWDWFRKNPQGAPLLVLPTGAGKSVILAEIAKKVAGKDKRVLIIAHRAELLEQNYGKLAERMPWGKIGLYCAGMRRRDTDCQVLVAGVHSVYKKAAELGSFALVMIDEAHLVPPDGEGRYRTLIDGLMENNPETRFLGCSATPYRLGSGMLTESGGLWTDIAYEVGLPRLIAEGYLSPLISKGGIRTANLGSVAVRGGEYVAEDLERAFNRYDLVESAVSEIVKFGADRKSWLIFASGVSHANSIAEAIRKVSIPVAVITGETPPLLREGTIADFKAGKIRAVVNVDVLTTGFDYPGIDLIALLRATKSTALYVQMLGRGCRIAEGKKDALVLDFGNNLTTHGPLDRITITKRHNPLTNRDEASVAIVPGKICPECQGLCVISAPGCLDCGYMFPDLLRLNHGVVASEAAVLSAQEPKHIVDVYAVNYFRHKKPEKEHPTMRVEYSISQIDGVPVGKVSEWVCFEHPSGYARTKAVQWWITHNPDPDGPGMPPTTIEDALGECYSYKQPRQIEIQKEGKFWRILRHIDLEKPPSDEGDTTGGVETNF
jgi:DNA repair protein RadD